MGCRLWGVIRICVDEDATLGLLKAKVQLTFMNDKQPLDLLYQACVETLITTGIYAPIPFLSFL